MEDQAEAACLDGAVYPDGSFQREPPRLLGLRKRKFGRSLAKHRRAARRTELSQADCKKPHAQVSEEIQIAFAVNP